MALLVTLLLQRGTAVAPAVVTGQLQMTDGSPAVAVRVTAIPAPPPNIRPTDGQNYYASQAPVSIALTDEAGVYRLANVPAGRYYIVGGAVGHATYHPGTTDIEAATVVTIAPESPVGRVDFKLLRPPGTRVRGRVTPAPAGAGQERAVVSGTLLGELLESPVRDDGTFEFGRVPRGSYLLSLYPPPSGMASLPFQVGEEDAVSLALVRPPARSVSGRIVVQNGPLPRALLGFSTPQGYVPGTIASDGTFTARLHGARHRVELGGLPVGYSIASVRLASSADVMAEGFVVAAADISGIVITLAAPRQLPRLRGRITGLDPARSPRVVITGPIVGSLEAVAQADGTFEFPAVPPGLYRVSVPQFPEIGAADVVVDAAGGEVQLSLRR